MKYHKLILECKRILVLPKTFAKKTKSSFKGRSSETKAVATVMSNDVRRIPTYQMYRREMNEIILPFPSSPITVQEGRGVDGG